ncbi:MAG: sugar phosphate isomerase/epimerase [Armatimonadetes bacterium]|nr:sugar phosphate isomerase/epimerase [Armatimonadota bacterium]
MKWSLHPVILGGSLTFEEQLAIARDTGYDGLDVNIDGLARMVEERGLEQVQRLFADYGVAPAGSGLPTRWRGGEDEFEEDLKALPALAQLMVDLDCPRTFTYFAPSTDGDPAEYRRFLVERFKAIGTVLADYGVRLGLEWLGPRHIRAGGTPVVWKMSQTLDLIADTGLDNLGLLFDVWHWFNAEDTLEELRALRPEQIVHCHFNDAPDKPLDEQLDMHREVPGRGIIPLVDVLRTLKDIGYQDYLAVEIFNDELKAMPPVESARLVKQACDDLMAQV